MSNPDPIALVFPKAGGKAAAGRALPLFIELSMANRHGLVAGATGTGKTVTLQSLAERFAAAGTSVFLADVKGDLSGLAAAGVSGANAKVDAALAAAGMATRPRAGLQAKFWDLYGERGTPLRAAVSDMGPLILGRALGLEEIQAEVLSIVFRIADDRGLDIIDLKDLRALLSWCGENAAELAADYGRMASSSLQAILRAVVVLEGQGGELFFGEPALDIADFLGRDQYGRGSVNVLAADKLVDNPSLYASFLLWLLSELFEELPEAGDLGAPKLVFFFDEAHLLFDGASPELVRSVVRTVRLIRSKGVGVWFVTQNPLDLPEDVLAQLGNRVQHALRAYTQKEMRAAKAAAESFRPNPGLDVEAALGELAVGEALVSFLGPDGVPAPVQRARIVPPLSRIGPLSEAERSASIKGSPLIARYGKRVDRVSAYEVLREGAFPMGAEPKEPAAISAESGSYDEGAARGAIYGKAADAIPAEVSPEEAMRQLEAELRGGTIMSGAYPGVELKEPGRELRAPPRAAFRETGPGQEFLESMARSAMRTAGNELARQLTRGLLGGLTQSPRRRRRS